MSAVRRIRRTSPTRTCPTKRKTKSQTNRRKIDEPKKLPSRGSLVHKIFVLTGTLTKTREEVSDFIVMHGGDVRTGVSSIVDFVVAGPDAITENTSKLQKAKKLGIPIISEKKLEDMVFV